MRTGKIDARNGSITRGGSLAAVRRRPEPQERAST